MCLSAWAFALLLSPVSGLEFYTSLLKQPAHQQGLPTLHTSGSGHILADTNLPDHMISTLPTRTCLAGEGGGDRKKWQRQGRGEAGESHRLNLKAAAGVSDSWVGV